MGMTRMKESIKVILSGLTILVVSLVGGILSNARYSLVFCLIGLSVALIGTFAYFYHDYQNESTRHKWLALFLFYSFVGAVFVLMVGAPAFQLSAADRANREATRCSIEAVRAGITVFDTCRKRLPTSLEELTIDTTNSAPLLNKANLNDAWGHPVRYTILRGSNFVIRSAGVDGKFGTADDLTN